jgi:hypothetical protein
MTLVGPTTTDKEICDRLERALVVLQDLALCYVPVPAHKAFHMTAEALESLRQHRLVNG